MRTLRLPLLAMAATTLVLLMAAACGGNGGDGGYGALELPPAGEYQFNV